jgi:hypothetical protein
MASSAERGAEEFRARLDPELRCRGVPSGALRPIPIEITGSIERAIG